jgi:2-polyprenyl-6-methoxyphenol hydroxylase-like FAD-dependent oxidoreductase
VPSWSNGRVTLIGDAASCVSLLGDGSTLAMTAAHTLATALAEQPGRPETAMRTYEARHRRLVASKQRGVGRAAALLVPASGPGLTLRNQIARLLTLRPGNRDTSRVNQPITR